VQGDPGPDDRLIPPSESEALEKANPLAQIMIIPNADHLVAFEQAEAINESIHEFLA
jgi:pimeloyl-ACP methyl ester carboxylesterase